MHGIISLERQNAWYNVIRKAKLTTVAETGDEYLT